MAKDDKKESIVEVARKRYQRAKDAYGTLRQQAIADTRFVMGDSDNNWQWPEEIYTSRSLVQKKPCLTINLTAQHCNQIINAIRQNRPTGRVLPVDNYADKNTAEILSGLCASIKSNSNADTAHDIAAEHAVYGGEGYWRVLTEYETDESFDQTIVIKPLVNPQLVYIDPDAILPDRSDAKWGFIFEDLSHEEARLEFPDIDATSWANNTSDGWVSKDKIRVAEYYYCEQQPDELYQLSDGTTALKSKLPEGSKVSEGAIFLPDGTALPIINKRETKRKQWYWCKLVGDEKEPVEKKEWPGSLLPIISVVGKEVNVNGEIVRKGIVRDLKDPARMVNYSYSASVETLALQNKIPYLASAEAIEGFEDIWGAANTDSRAYLPWNAYDEEGRQLPKPERQAPAAMATAQVQMLQLSTEEMRAASGQQNANFGIKSEAASGVGIQRLKAQGEVATFHFPDNLARALTYEMRVLIDLIPKIFDTKRIVRILGLDGKETKAVLDPEMQQPYAEMSVEGEVEKIFNPLMGRYDVAIDTGPSYHTQRQEAAEVLTELTTRNPQIMQVAGDIVMRSYDFPMADEMAKRLEKTLPPGLKEEKGAPPELPMEVQQQMQQAEQQIRQLDQAIQGMQAEMDQKDQELRAAQLKAQQEQAKAMSLKLEIEKRDAIQEIQQAMPEEEEGPDHEGMEMEKEEREAQNRLREKALEVAGQIVIAQMNKEPQEMAMPENAEIDQTALIMDRLIQTQEALLAQISAPRQAQISITRNPDGSFVGQRIEQ